MAGWKDVIDAIETKLNALETIEKVNTKWGRYSTDEEKKEGLTEELDGGKLTVNAVFIERSGIVDQRGGQGSRYPLQEGSRSDTYLITFFYGYYDDGASVEPFNERVEDIMDAFWHDITLVDDSTVAGGIRAEPLDYVNFSGYLCHRARFTLEIERRKVGPFS